MVVRSLVRGFHLQVVVAVQIALQQLNLLLLQTIQLNYGLTDAVDTLNH